MTVAVKLKSIFTIYIVGNVWLLSEAVLLKDNERLKLSIYKSVVLKKSIRGLLSSS